jgi:TetR/AcrR family transcriptional regulator, regulator of cefoperazone and chloramphenicol sensitivity
MVERGIAPPSDDPAVRAAFLLVNDLALILLCNHVAVAIGVDPITPEGLDRWAREVTLVYTEGAFRTQKEP